MALSSNPWTSAGQLEDEKFAEALQHEIGIRPLKMPRTVIRAICIFIACVTAHCTSDGVLKPTLFAIWPGRWDWCLNPARGRVLHSWAAANLSDTVLHSSVINLRGRWLDLEASKLPSGGDGSIGVMCLGWCVSSEVRAGLKAASSAHVACTEKARAW
jgi:hypothetical protein